MVRTVELGLLFEISLLNLGEVLVHRAEEGAAILVGESTPIAHPERI